MGIASSQIWTPGDSPGAAPTGKQRFYINNLGELKVVDDAGIETDVGGGGSTPDYFISASTSMHSFNSVATQYPAWNDTFKIGSKFTHSDTANAHQITAAANMEVLVSYNLSVRSNVADPVKVRGILRIGNTFQNHTDVYCHLHSNANVNENSLILPEAYLSLNAGDIVSLHVQIAYNDTSFGDVANVYTNGGQITVRTI